MSYKYDDVTKAAEQKLQELASTPVQESKQTQVINATADKLRQFQEAEVERTRYTTVTEDIGDFINTMDQFGIAVAKGTHGAADMATAPLLSSGNRASIVPPMFGASQPYRELQKEIRPNQEPTGTTLEQEFGIGETLDHTSKLVQDYYASDVYKAQSANIEQRNAIKEAEAEFAYQERVADGYNPIFANILKHADVAGGVFEHYLSNPRALTVDTAQSAGHLVGAGLTAKAARSMLTKKLAKSRTPDELATYLKSDEGVALLNRASTSGALTYTGVLEGGSNQADTKQEILNTPFEQLEKVSPRYNALIKEGVSPEQARNKVATEGSTFAGVVSGLGAVGISAGLGTDKLAGSLFKKGTLRDKAFQAFTGSVREGTEEGLQSASNTIAKNLGVSVADKEKAIDEGLGKEIATGALLGTFSTAPTVLATGTSLSTQGVAKSVSSLTKGIKNAVRDEDVKSAIDSGDHAYVLDTEATHYDPAKALEVLTAEKTLKEAEDKSELAVSMYEHIEKAIARHTELQNILKSEEFGSLSKEEKTTLTKEFNKYKGANGILEKSLTAYNAINDLDDVQAKEEVKEDLTIIDNKQSTERVFGTLQRNPKAIDDKTLDTLSKSEHLSDEQKEVVNTHIELRKTAQDVSGDIAKGKGETFTGMSTYLTQMGKAVKTTNTDMAQGILDRVSKFKEHQENKVKGLKDIFNALGKESEQATIDKFNETYGSSNNPAYQSTFKWLKDDITLEEKKHIVRSNINDISKDNELINKTQRALQLTHDLTFNKQEDTVTPVEPEVKTEPVVAEPKVTQPTTEETAVTKQEQPQVVDAQVTEQVDEGKKEESVQETIEPKVEAPVEDVTTKSEPKQTKQQVTVEKVIRQATTSITNTLGLSEANTLKIQDEIVKAVDTLKGKFKTPRDVKTLMGQIQEGITDSGKGIPSKTKSKAYTFGYELGNKYNLNKVGALRKTITKGKASLNKLSEFIKGVKPNVLNSYNNVFETLINDKEVREKHDITDEDVAALKTLEQFTGKFADAFKAVYKPVPKAYRKVSNTFDWFLNSNLDEGATPIDALDPNILNALATVGLEYVVNDASDVILDEQAVKSIYGLSDNHPALKDKTFMNFALYAGDNQTRVVSNLGKKALKAIGTSLDTSKLSANEIALLENNAGIVVVRLLTEMGLLQQTAVDSAVAKKGSPVYHEGLAVFSKSRYIRPASIRTKAGLKLDARNQNWVSAIGSSAGIFDKLTGNASLPKYPSVKRPTKTAKKFKNTFMDLPKRVQKIALKHSQRPQIINKGMFDFLTDLPDELVTAVFGSKELDNVHITERDSQQAINDSILRDWNNAKEHKAGLANDGMHFFYNHEVWSNLRMGIGNNGFNPQGSKVARALASSVRAKIIIDRSNEKLVKQFKLAMAEFFGVSVDKKHPEVALQELNTIVNSDWFNDMVEGYLAIKETGKPLNEYTAPFLYGLNKLGHNGESLVALQAWIEYKQSNTGTFETQLTREVDGITNGVSIAMMLYAGDFTKHKEILEKTGIFFDGKYGTYADFLAAGENDNYQTTMEKVGKAVTDPISNMVKLSRNLFKPPTMVTIYGSGIDGVMNEFNDAVINDFYNDIMKARELYLIGDPKGMKDFVEVLSRIDRSYGYSILVDTNGNPKIDINKASEMTIDEMLASVGSKGTELEIRNDLTNAYKEEMEAALKESFGWFMDVRNEINKAYNAQAQLGIEELNNTIANEAKKLGRDLTVDEVNELTYSNLDMLPTLKTAMSGSNNEGMLILNSESDFAEGKDKSVVTFSTPTLRYIYKNGQFRQGKGAKEMSATPLEYNWTDGGVKAPILSVHSSDATTMLKTLEGLDVFNVHDAIYIPLDMMEEGVEAINVNLIETMVEYNPIQNVLDSITGYNYTPSNKLLKAHAKLGEATNNLMMLESTVARNKELLLSRIKGVSQYNDNQTVVDVNPIVKTEVNKEATPEVLAKELVDSIIESTTTENPNKEEVPSRLTARELSSPMEVFLDKYYENGVVTAAGRNTDFYQDNKDAITNFIKDYKRTFGSQAVFDIDPNNFNANYETTVDPADVNNIFQRLETKSNKAISSEHRTRLTNVLDKLISKAIKPFNYKEATTSEINAGLVTGDDVFLNVSTAANPLAGSMSAQEAYVHELSHMISRYGIDHDSVSRKALEDIYRVAFKHMSIQDFLPNGIKDTDPNYAAELQLATDTYNYIFKNTTSGRNNYLHEFFTYGLTNERFIAALNKPEINDALSKRAQLKELKGDNLFETLVNVLNRMLDLFNEAVLALGGIKGMMSAQKRQAYRKDTPEGKIWRIANRMVQQDQLQKRNLRLKNDFLDRFDSAILDQIRKYIVAPLEKFATSPRIIESEKVYVRAAGKIVNTVLFKNMDDFNKVIREVTRRLNFSETNMLSGFLSEMNINDKSQQRWFPLIRSYKKNIDKVREDVMGDYKKYILAMVGDYSEDTRKAITKGLLMTDVSILLDNETKPSDIRNLFADSTLLANEIETLNNELNQFTESNWYKAQAKNLGNYMVTNKDDAGFLMKNAKIISKGWEGFTVDDATAARAEPIINKLATLYAIKATTTTDKQAVVDFIDKESKATTPDNGFTSLLKLHRTFKEESADTLFDGSDYQIEKGYIKNITNPSVDFIVADMSERERLENEGYKFHSMFNGDINTSFVKSKGVFVNPFGGKQGYVSSAVSIQNKAARGTDILSVLQQEDPLNAYNLAGSEVNKVTQAKRRIARDMRRGVTTSVKGNSLIPIFNNEGKAINYRFEMNEDARADILEKDYKVENVLSAMFASIPAKVNTTTQNDLVVEALHDQFIEDYNDNASDYVQVGLNSQNSEYRELYQRLPHEMRQSIRDKFGSDNFYVKGYMLDVIFGYSKFTPVRATKANAALQQAEKGFLNQLGKVFVDIVGLNKLRGAQDIWQELVKFAKSTIVIRFVSTLIGNVGSNTIAMLASGVSPLAIAKGYAKATIEAKRYEKLRGKLEQLKIDMSVKGQTAAKVAEIRRLEDSLQNNPIAELVDAGLYSTIVEDVEMLDDQYSYKNQIDNFIDPVISKVPANAQKVFANIFMTQNSVLFKFMNDATKLSDFVARYTLHEHNKKKGMDPAASVENVSKVFVSYDVPTNKFIQYLNDMGLVMFTKFLFRIQQVILQQWKSKPATQLSLLLGQNLLGDVSDITDSLMGINAGLNTNFNPLFMLENYTDIATLDLVD